MTLTEAYRVLRRFVDWHSCRDYRGLSEALPKREHQEAFTLILHAQGLGTPIADCGHCKHSAGEGLPNPCKLRVKGACTKFEEVQP